MTCFIDPPNEREPNSFLIALMFALSYALNTDNDDLVFMVIAVFEYIGPDDNCWMAAGDYFPRITVSLKTQLKDKFTNSTICPSIFELSLKSREAGKLTISP